MDVRCRARPQVLLLREGAGMPQLADELRRRSLALPRPDLSRTQRHSVTAKATIAPHQAAAAYPWLAAAGRHKSRNRRGTKGWVMQTQAKFYIPLHRDFQRVSVSVTAHPRNQLELQCSSVQISRPLPGGFFVFTRCAQARCAPVTPGSSRCRASSTTSSGPPASPLDGRADETLGASVGWPPRITRHLPHHLPACRRQLGT